MHKITVLIVLFLIFFVFPTKANAIYNPLSVPNNKFGIHILDTNDLNDAAKLVNTNGDWGYVTIVITKTERDTGRWQKVFDHARRLHLIPIVRIATRFDGTNWEKPNFDENDGWVSFLNSLNWVIKNRYVVIGNEPNHATEWGGQVRPDEYAKWLKTISEKLKSSSSDFFILPAGFDASAPNSPLFKITMDEKLYLEKMIASEQDIFNNLDGWTSHSYPNPNFSGSENGVGRGTIKNYEWELNTLKGMGVQKELPVFITETGWAHKVQRNEKYLNVALLSHKYQNAFENSWNDPRIVSITPFVLSYINKPFDNFSWKDPVGNFYDFYDTVSNLPKLNGEPLQFNDGEIVSGFIPAIYSAVGEINGFVIVKNTGQAIWDNRNLSLEDGQILKIRQINFEKLEPNQIGVISFTGESPSDTENVRDQIWLTFKGIRFGKPFSFYSFKLRVDKLNKMGIFDKIVSLFRGFV